MLGDKLKLRRHQMALGGKRRLRNPILRRCDRIVFNRGWKKEKERKILLIWARKIRFMFQQQTLKQKVFELWQLSSRYWFSVQMKLPPSYAELTFDARQCASATNRQHCYLYLEADDVVPVDPHRRPETIIKIQFVENFAPGKSQKCNLW